MKTLKYITEDPIVWASEQDNEWGMPQCAHPCWVNEYHEFDLRSAPRSTLLYEETKLNVGLTQTLISKTSLGKTDCLYTCVRAKASMQGWGYALVWPCQSIKQRHPQWSQLFISSASDHGLEVSKLNGKEICDPWYHPKQWRPINIPYSISRRSLSEWTALKQTRDLMASGWSYDSDRNVGQGWKVNEMMGNKGQNT